jgi:hypothetical protein
MTLANRKGPVLDARELACLRHSAADAIPSLSPILLDMTVILISAAISLQGDAEITMRGLESKGVMLGDARFSLRIEAGAPASPCDCHEPRAQDAQIKGLRDSVVAKLGQLETINSVAAALCSHAFKTAPIRRIAIPVPGGRIAHIEAYPVSKLEIFARETWSKLSNLLEGLGRKRHRSLDDFLASADSITSLQIRKVSRPAPGHPKSAKGE